MVYRIIKRHLNQNVMSQSNYKIQEVVGFTGDEAAAFAAKQSNVDVVAAYPITPQTIIVERFSNYVSNGEVDTEFVCVESEHSAMSASVGASLTGARVFTATSSQGLALMHEVLYLASGMRCPIVMANVNRALSSPINIHCDHQDIMGSRDCGWLQIYAENAQEVYDWIIQAFKIAENSEVMLPIVINLDGFTISHCMEDLKILSDEDIQNFIPERVTKLKLDPSEPMTLGGLSLPEYYFEIKRQQEEALRHSIAIVDKITEEYSKISGREYGVLETFAMEDAEAAIICLGSTAGTIRSVIKKLRKDGKKVGLIKIWLFRPFPKEELLTTIKNLKALAVLERTISFGAPSGPLFSDIASSLKMSGSLLKIFNAIYGLGGRDISLTDIEEILNDALEVASTGIIKDNVKFMGVRE